jgi:hypothetical protein
MPRLRRADRHGADAVSALRPADPVISKPKAGTEYLFVRRTGDTIENARYTRSYDGSALVLIGDKAEVFEMSPEAWRLALAELHRQGFSELSEAIALGTVPSDWKAPP